MHTFCHRCGGELPHRDGATTFCPHCGAPQLYLLEHLLEDAPDGSALAPPDARQIDWQMAIRCAGFVGLVTPVLCLLSSVIPFVSLASFVWIVSGSVIAIGLYQKQRPSAYMDARTGANIGILVGLMMAVALGIMVAFSGLIARFGLHSMSAFDADFSTKFHAQIDQMAAQMPAGSSIPPATIAFLLSPEVRAGLWLSVVAMLGGMLLILSTLGGAFAGFLRTRSRTAV